MFITKQITKNKAVEFSLFTGGWKAIIDGSLSWTTENPNNDHWGFNAYLVLFGKKIFEFSFYDIRHADDEDE